MAAIKFVCESYSVGERFHRAMQAKALSLESAAKSDEDVAASLDNPDHLRRQRLLIQAQRDEAERLRDFLARTTLHRPTSG